MNTRVQGEILRVQCQGSQEGNIFGEERSIVSNAVESNKIRMEQCLSDSAVFHANLIYSVTILK